MSQASSEGIGSEGRVVAAFGVDVRHVRLVNAVTEYDRKQSTKRGYNIWALGHYMKAARNASMCIGKGMTWRQALCNSFNGRLLDVCLKATGEALATKQELRGAL